MFLCGKVIFHIVYILCNRYFLVAKLVALFKLLKANLEYVI